MLSLSRTRFFLGLTLLVSLVASTGISHGQGAKKNIDFKTADGVKIQGTFYPNPSGKRDAVVILLHDFDLKKGGSSQDEGWSDLATSLHKAGFSVLSFDFRGFGESKEVDPEAFWKHRHNVNFVKGALKKSAEISSTGFNGRYIPFLVNDIAAAKAYLDRQNDQNLCNTSSTILIGAGEGATLGAIWMAHEARRRKDNNPPNPLLVAPPLLGDPESRDLAAGIWLTISPRLGSVNVGRTIGSLLHEVGNRQKVPQALIFGKGDGAADTFCRGLAKTINPRGSKDKEFGFTGVEVIPDTKLSGHKLLGKNSEAQKFIVEKYLPKLMEARGNKERVQRKVQESAYWYTQAKGGNRPYRINKKPGEEVPPVDLNLFLPGF